MPQARNSDAPAVIRVRGDGFVCQFQSCTREMIAGFDVRDDRNRSVHDYCAVEVGRE